MAERFTGTIGKLCNVRVAPLINWLKGVPHDDWRHLGDSKFEEWGLKFSAIPKFLLTYFPGCSGPFGIWRMDPGQYHPTHTDLQPDNWIVRLHVPLITNKGAVFTMNDGEHHLDVGYAYKFNPLSPHAVENRGKDPRFHLVMDVLQ